MPDRPSQWVSLCSSALEAVIDPLGAQLSILRDRNGRDLLWDGNPAFWSGRAPLLFPIVGALNGGHYRIGARSYDLSRHGFARGRAFEVLESTAARATFRLTADESTLAVYPFRFELEVQYDLMGSTLALTTHVRNLGRTAMPASLGYHPAFRWPLPYGHERSSHFVEFAGDEPAPIRRLDGAGLLTPQPHPTPVRGRRLPLADSLFEAGVVIFDQVRSRSVTYGADSGPRIRVDYADSTYLGMWSKPGAGFICIEPWHGVADPVDYTGEFTEQPGVFTVPPDTAVPIRIEITLVGDP